MDRKGRQNFIWTGSFKKKLQKDTKEIEKIPPKIKLEQTTTNSILPSAFIQVVHKKRSAKNENKEENEETKVKRQKVMKEDVATIKRQQFFKSKRKEELLKSYSKSTPPNNSSSLDLSSLKWKPILKAISENHQNNTKQTQQTPHSIQLKRSPSFLLPKKTHEKGSKPQTAKNEEEGLLKNWKSLNKTKFEREEDPVTLRRKSFELLEMRPEKDEKYEKNKRVEFVSSKQFSSKTPNFQLQNTGKIDFMECVDHLVRFIDNGIDKTKEEYSKMF